MKIQKLILRNFAAIKNCLNSNEIEIDFSDTMNKICILIGPNGSGKTTLLSLLHPFSDLGTLDVRNANKLILQGKDGYKEIHITKDNDYYIIKHNYTHKKDTHSIKSYIEKNGNELNVNGNVSSFKEYVKLELQIEPDYLKLIRLGSNVTNLINLTSTERKNFMSKIMEDINIYLEYYKSVNGKLKQLNDMISHTVDKISKLNIIDKKDASNNIENLREKRCHIENELNNLISESAILQNNIDNILSEVVNDVHSDLKEAKKKYEKLEHTKNKLDSNMTLEEYVNKKDELTKSLNSYDNELHSNKLLINSNINTLDVLNNQLHGYQIQISKELEFDNECKKMENNLKYIEDKLDTFDDEIKEFNLVCSSEEFSMFNSYIKYIQQELVDLYRFGNEPISKVVKLMKNKKDVTKYINSHLIDMDTTENTSAFMLKISTMLKLITNNSDDIVFSCKSECAAKNLFNQLSELLKDSTVDDKNKSADFYNDMDLVHKGIVKIISSLTQYAQLIDKLPDDIKDNFKLDNIYKKIEKCELICDEDKLIKYLSNIISYEEYLKLLKDYDENKTKYNKFIKLSKSNTSDLIEELEKEISIIKEKNVNYSYRNGELQELITSCNYDLEFINDAIEYTQNYDLAVKDYNEKQNRCENYDIYTNKLNDIKVHQTLLKKELDDITNEIEIKVSELDQYKSLKKELKSMNTIYDDMTILKESLSSKEGIPLHIIKTYLNNTEYITNELLDIVYNGNIYIDNFHITSTEFTIPFYNKGILIPDVKYASQGELSFLSIALSFALSSQILNKYNIMLLDEIDGPLDNINREKFINILENQIDRINSEQNFLITHNDMFSSYPVDIIDLSGNNNRNDYPLAHFINIKKK